MSNLISLTVKMPGGQWSNYVGARGGLPPPPKDVMAPLNVCFERVYKGACKKPPWNHPSINDCNISF